MSRNDFLSLMKTRGHSTQIARAVCEELVSYLPNIDQFSIHPGDHLIRDYDIDMEEIEGILSAIFEKANQKIPDRKSQQAWIEANGQELTVEWIVIFVDAMRGQENQR